MPSLENWDGDMYIQADIQCTSLKIYMYLGTGGVLGLSGALSGHEERGEV